jgi:hypothetical protein
MRGESRRAACSVAISASLSGRLRNTSLPKSRALLPLFEAVVNAIQAVPDESGFDAGTADIEVRIVRGPQIGFEFELATQSAYVEPITAFIVRDNGVGFDDRNMESFQTLDTEYKPPNGGRGVGRLLWLKAFDKVEVSSVYLDEDWSFKERDFTFTAAHGISQDSVRDARGKETGTEVRLLGFRDMYQKSAPKNVLPIAKAILEHCLWYFVRPGGAPHIIVTDGCDSVDLNLLCEEYMLASSKTETVSCKGRPFYLTHLRLKAGSRPNPELNWCAANRVVFEENLSGKIAGLHGKLRDGAGEFLYACFLESPYLDASVRPERTGFEIPDASDEEIIDPDELSMAEIRAEVLAEVKKYLHENLDEVLKAGRARVEDFVAKKAPRYRPILGRLSSDKLGVDPGIGDKDLELQLHRHLADIEAELIEEGQEVLQGQYMQGEEYSEKLRDYLEKVDDVKKSDLAAYVSRRRVILDLLDKAIQADRNGRYAREDVVHRLIMPMRTTSNEAPESASNLWVIDEGLAFHDYLASDKPIGSMPITGSSSALEPDVLALQVYDQPILVAQAREGTSLASIVVVEIKRPMRNDVAPGPEKDPVAQALRYLKQVRDGKVMTASGRPVLGQENIPGFCYVIADLTQTLKDRCMESDLQMTPDRRGFFGYNNNFKAYVEVISFDRLLDMAHRRNRAFFDRLGLPVTN